MKMDVNAVLLAKALGVNTTEISSALGRENVYQFDAGSAEAAKKVVAALNEASGEKDKKAFTLYQVTTSEAGSEQKVLFVLSQGNTQDTLRAYLDHSDSIQAALGRVGAARGRS